MNTIEECNTVSDKDKVLLSEMKKIIRKIIPTATVLLYGSVARGTQGPESDYDTLVLTDESVSKKDRCEIERQILDLELARDVILSTIYHSSAEWRMRSTLPFHNEVEKYGVSL